MDFLSKTFNYIFIHGKGKRFLLFSLFSLIPSALLAKHFPLSDYIAWFVNYGGGHGSWASLWLGIFRIRPFELIFIAVAIVSLVFYIACTTSLIMRHLRIGKFDVPKLFHLFNENFFPAIHSVLMAMLIGFVGYTAGTFFLYLWTFAPTVLGLVMSILTILLFSMLIIYLFSAMTFWLPVMAMCGLSAYKALGDAFIRSRRHHRKFILTYSILFLIILLFSFFAYIARDVQFISWILTTVGYNLALVFAVPFCIISYFDAESITREDLIRSPYLR